MTSSSKSRKNSMRKLQSEKNPSFEFGTGQMKDLLKSGQNRLKSFFVNKTEGSLFSKSARSRDVLECRCKSSADAKMCEEILCRNFHFRTPNDERQYKKEALSRARVTNSFRYSEWKVEGVKWHGGLIVVNYGKVWSLWTPRKPSKGSLQGLQTVKALCLEGHPVAIWRYWQLKEEALNVLSASGYVQVREEQKEDGDVVKYPNYLLFLLICTPKELDSLEQACESGKDLLLSPFLAENGAELLKRCNYSQVSPSSLDSDLIHFKIFHSSLRKLKFKPLGRKPIHMEDYIKFDWFEGKSMIDGVLPNNQSVLVNLVLQPQLRHQGCNVFFTLTVPNLSVDVEKSIASSLKCFPDSIKLTLKPLWPGSEYLVPTTKLNNCNRDMVKVINTTSGMHKVIIMTRKANDSIEKVIESAGAAGVEWIPNYRGVWHGGYDLYYPNMEFQGHRYDPDSYGRLSPECPDLNGMLEVEWALDKKSEEMEEGKAMSVEVRLEFGIQCLCFGKEPYHFVFSPELKVEEFCVSAQLNITLPSISSSSASVMHTQQEINEEAFEGYSARISRSFLKQEKQRTPFSEPSKGKEPFTAEHAKDEKIEDLEGCWATLEFSSTNSGTKKKYVKSSRKVVDTLTDASPFLYFSEGKSMTNFLRDKDLMTGCKGLWLDFPLQKALAIELGIALDGPLSYLVYLDLSHIGNDPRLFSFLSKPLSKPSSRLLYLDLSNNAIKIFKDAPNVPCLQHLDLSNTHHTNRHKHSHDEFIYWRFSDLHYLNLSNSTTFSLHWHFSKGCPELRHLDLSNNQVHCFDNSFQNLLGLLHNKGLLSVNLQGNDLDHNAIRMLTRSMEHGTCHLLRLRL